jgi:hypothetical protein
MMPVLYCSGKTGRVSAKVTFSRLVETRPIRDDVLPESIG